MYNKMNLYQAAKLGDIKLIEEIKGNHYLNTGLNGASESNNLDLIKYFIKHGAWDINSAYTYTTDDNIKKYFATFNGTWIGPKYVVDVPNI
jgi:hypothetical protein